MGKQFVDQYSILHFSSGVLAYFWGVPAKNWFFLNVGFEIIENTEFGMKIINEKFTYWPGGKPFRDSFLNGLGDTLSSLGGWYVASKIDQFSS